MCVYLSNSSYTDFNWVCFSTLPPYDFFYNFYRLYICNIYLLYNLSMLLDLILSGYNFIVAPICCMVVLV